MDFDRETRVNVQNVVYARVLFSTGVVFKIAIVPDMFHRYTREFEVYVSILYCTVRIFYVILCIASYIYIPRVRIGCLLGYTN